MRGLVGAHVGAVAVVCCVHDRVKDEWVDEGKFRAALLELGADLSQLVTHKCACCRNLYVRRMDDTPGFCQQCSGQAKFPLGGPLPDPIGAIR